MDCTIVWTLIGMIVAVIGTGIAVIGFVYTFMRNFKQDVSARIDKLDADTQAQIARIDQCNSRMDQLYKMFYELLKSHQAPKTNP